MSPLKNYEFLSRGGGTTRIEIKIHNFLQGVYIHYDIIRVFLNYFLDIEYIENHD